MYTSWLHERTNLGSNVAVRGHLWRWFSSSIFIWLSGIKLILPGLSGKNLSPLSHLTGPQLVLKDLKSPRYNLPFKCKQTRFKKPHFCTFKMFLQLLISFWCCECNILILTTNCNNKLKLHFKKRKLCGKLPSDFNQYVFTKRAG